MYKVAVLGDMDSILGFLAIGFSVFAVSCADEVDKTITNLAAEDYAIIYITEQAARYSQAVIDKYRDVMVPAIILIPGKNGSLGMGQANVKKSVEKAVGADILATND